MNINPIQQGHENLQTSFKKGLYFTKSSHIEISKKFQNTLTSNETIRESKEGFKYIVDTQTPQALKEKLAKIPFIKQLAEKYDTFIFCGEPFKCSFFNDYYSYLRVMWADRTKANVRIETFSGQSSISEQKAQEHMLNSLEKASCNIK